MTKEFIEEFVADDTTDNIECPEYDYLAELLHDANIPLTPSELHGMLCGLICAADKWTGDSWLTQILGDEQATNFAGESCRNEIMKLHKYSKQQLQEMSFDLCLLLPDDEVDFMTRSQSLGELCQGLLQALDFSGVKIKEEHSEDCQDALLYFAQIAKMANIHSQCDEITEQDEYDYNEVVEYVRLAVIALYSEFVGN